MKKIFLTSGIIACMACPAFAEGESFGGHTSGTETGACVQPQLGVYSGDTTLSAQWTANYSTIELKENTAANGWGGSVNADPDYLYGIPLDTTHVYTRTGNNDTDYVFTNANAITASPVGKTVTLSYAANKPSTARTGTDVQGMPAANNGGARAFKGFYSAQTGGDQYIDNTLAVTTAGKTAAGGYTAGTSHDWFAQYDCVKFNTAPTAPTLEGHQFLGWATSTDQCAQAKYVDFATQCLDADTQLVACWSANTINITWDNNGATTNAVTTGATNTCTYSSDVTLPTAPSRTGYQFSGWKVNNASGNQG